VVFAIKIGRTNPESFFKLFSAHLATNQVFRFVLLKAVDMGVCFSKQELFSGVSSENENGRDKILYGNEESREKEKREDATTRTNGVPRVMLGGTCSYASMFTQQGRKGVNQDAMTIWEVRCIETFSIS
jgi:hypothetical protein